MKREVVVLGIGMTVFGRFPNIHYYDLGADAVLDTLKDAGIEWKNIPVMYCSAVTQGGVPGQHVQLALGSTGIPIINISNACSAGNTAFLIAYQAVSTGLYNIALALGIEKMPRQMIVDPGDDSPEARMGLRSPAIKYAQLAQRWIYEGRCTPVQMAKVSVKNHKNGYYNPRSQYHVQLTVEEILASRMICDPLHLYDCCPTTDGAAAVILCTEKLARRYTSQPFTKVAGCGLSSTPFVRGDPGNVCQTSHNATFEAYQEAGVGPKDIDVVELHDAFTISELQHYEDMGLCEVGEAVRLIDEGATEITGHMPVNPSGGLLAKGHPVGATGIAQICELVWQLRGQAGQRQVNNPKVGLAHSIGGGWAEACGVNILKK